MNENFDRKRTNLCLNGLSVDQKERVGTELQVHLVVCITEISNIINPVININ